MIIDYESRLKQKEMFEAYRAKAEEIRELNKERAIEDNIKRNALINYCKNLRLYKF